jgi:hypothetical protein
MWPDVIDVMEFWIVSATWQISRDHGPLRGCGNVARSPRALPDYECEERNADRQALCSRIFQFEDRQQRNI